MKKKFFIGKSRLCLLVLLCALFSVRISYSDTCDTGASGNCGCPYSITDENGDGTLETLTIGDGTACTMAGNVNDVAYFYPWTGKTYRKNITTININDHVKTGETVARMFSGVPNVSDWSDLAKLDVSETKNFTQMFSYSNFSDTNALSGWKVDNATNMYQMFTSCKQLTDLTALSGWNSRLSNVTNMQQMFSLCTNLQDLTGIGDWDVSNVTNMYGLFSYDGQLTNLTPLAGWNSKLSKVTDMSCMFVSCTVDDLTAIGGWNVSNVENMTSMFMSCKSLTDLTALSGWDVSNVTNMSSMFMSCKNLTSLDGIRTWNVSKVTNMLWMFKNCTALKKANFLTDTRENPSKWDFSNSNLNKEEMLDGVNSAVNLDQYHTDMQGTKLYVYGKHSYRDFGNNGDKTDLTSDPDNLVFEPYTVAVTYTGATVSTSISDASNQHTEAEAYYDAVADWKGSDMYDAGNYYFQYGGGGTLTFTPAAKYSIQSVTLDGAAQTASDSITLSNITADHNIVVALQPAPATVTYSAGDGTGTPPAPYDGRYFDTIILPSGKGLSKPGYGFAGWSDGSNTYKAGDSYTVNAAAVTMSAVYGILYKVTYVAGDAETGDVPAEESYVAGDTVPVKENTGNLARLGYSFAGWSDGTNPQLYAAGSDFEMPDNDVTLTATFTQNPAYTLTFAAGEGVSGTVPAAIDVIAGTTTKLPSQGNLTKPGYIFTGWSDGINSPYAAESDFTMLFANVTLKAVFDKVYTVTYEKGDADVIGDVPAAATYKAGAAVTVPDGGNLTKSGSFFSGWSDGTKTYAAGTVFPMPDHDMTLTAKFTKDTAFYTLTFAKEEGVSGDVPQAMKVSSGILVALPAQGNLAKPNFYFAGWSDGTTVYAAGGCYLTTSRDATLTAVFKEVQPLQADYALAIPAVQTAKYPEAGNAQISYDPSKIQASWVEVKVEGESVALPKNEDEQGNTIFKCTDKSNPQISYPFIGWIVEKVNSQQANAVDVQTRNAESTTQIYWINQTTSFPMPAYSITLRPLFSYKQYAVTFDGNGADPVTVPPTQYFYYGEYAKNLWNPLTQGAPVKEGYTFTGWRESIKGEETGNVYNYDDQFVMPENDVKLMAQFASDSEGYTLTYKSGDAQYGYPPIAETIPAGTSVTIRGNDGGLGKEDHEFTLWSDGSVEYIPGTTIVMPEEDLSLYPVFVKVPDPLPEDEIGTYSFDEAGNKFYIQFHSYDICMNYMGDDNLCRNTSTNLYNR